MQKYTPVGDICKKKKRKNNYDSRYGIVNARFLKRAHIYSVTLSNNSNHCTRVTKHWNIILNAFGTSSNIPQDILNTLEAIFRRLVRRGYISAGNIARNKNNRKSYPVRLQGARRDL